MDQVALSRRGLMAGGLAAPLAACATGPLAPQIQVNLSDLPQPLSPPPAGITPPPDPGAELQAGFDPVLRMTVPVTIEGAGPFIFVVDTGANHTSIATEVAQGLGLPSGGTAMVHGIAGAQPAPTALVKTMTIGGAAANRRMRMPLLPRSALGADGLMGVDVLERRHVSLDFARNRFNIAPSDDTFTRALSTGGAGRLRSPALDPDTVVVPARYRFGQLTIVDAEVGAGLPVTAFLDSGAQSTVGNLALREAAFRQDEGLALRTTRVQLVGATGQTVSGDLARLPGLRLGGLRIGNLSCVFADLHTFKIWQLIDTPAILIGMDVMRHFRAIELDFARRKVIFRTPKAPVIAGPAPRP
jgi:hypothetical protein